MPYNQAMTGTEDKRIAEAAAAAGDRIALFLYDPSPNVIRTLLENRNLREEDVLIIAGRKNLPPEILESIFRDKRWTESYPVRLALAKNPKTPLFTALSIARFLRLFDVAALTRSHSLPVMFRKKLESLVVEKLPGMARGVKKSLAKISSGEILMKLIQDGYPDVVKLCLDNPTLVESHLYKVLSHRNTTPGAVRTIAEHANWSHRYHVKFALLRNEHTPLARSVMFLPDIKTADLRELYRDRSLPPGIRPHIHRELLERGENPDALSAPEEEKVYEIEESEMEGIEAEMKAFEYPGMADEETPGEAGPEAADDRER